MNNQKKYNTYRQTFKEFVYEGYEYDVQPDGLHISFWFHIDGSGQRFEFRPKAHVLERPFLNFNQEKAVMDTLVFNIGMVELISYWKCLCPQKVEVRCGCLSDEQISFWKKLYFNGLGEFFYTNSIRATLEDFMTISSTMVGSNQFSVGNPQSSIGRYLVPIGGGKDSVVTLECLRGANGAESVVPLIMNPRGATIECIQAGGYTMDDVLVIKRGIDQQLLDLNAKGALNGHTPFSAMLAFYTMLAAQLSGIPNVALSNESSANESTVVGTNVNHQYSKSLEFEDDFRKYVKDNISTQFNYFSFLRPLSELQIAMLFAQNEKYFDVFKSCNAGSKQDIWCGKCAKCLFAYIILSPFIAPERLNAIFGKNMLDDPEMENFFLELAGKAETKPFECVGTIDEVNVALGMTMKKWYNADNMPCLLRGFVPSQAAMDLKHLFLDNNLSQEELNLLASKLVSE